MYRGSAECCCLCSEALSDIDTQCKRRKGRRSRACLTAADCTCDNKALDPDPDLGAIVNLVLTSISKQTRAVCVSEQAYHAACAAPQADAGTLRALSGMAQRLVVQLLDASDTTGAGLPDYLLTDLTSVDA